MKKLLLVSVFTIIGFTVLNAQGQFRAGVSGGLPIGDAGDLATFAIAVDLGYLFELSETIEAGPVAGYSHSFGDDVTEGPITVEVDDIQFMPIGAGGRFNVSDNFSIGADVGYAIGISDDNDGGFYYAPRATYYAGQSVYIVAAYRGVTVDNGSWDIISLGIEFGIGESGE